MSPCPDDTSGFTDGHYQVHKSAFHLLLLTSLALARRLYSDYLYFASANKSAEDFHEKVSESLQLFESCVLDFSLRACVYNNSLNNAMPVRISANRVCLPALGYSQSG